MNLNVLKQRDLATANGILAAAALASAPDPGIGERPQILNTYRREAEEALQEIRRNLGIPPAYDSKEIRASISKVLAGALRQSSLSQVNAAEALPRIGRAGLLSPAAYNVVQPPEFRATFYRLGITQNHVEDAVKRPDDHQHLMIEGMPPEWRDISLFMKRVLSREERKRHWLLVQTHRTGVDQKVVAAWRIYPQDLSLELARQPLDVLRAFVEIYGVPIRVGSITALFLESQLSPPGTSLKVDWTGAPQDHFLSISSTTDALGQLRVGVAYCIDLPRYRAALKAHGLSLDERPPTHQTLVQTTTMHAK